jgi:hypothetical protein
MLVIALPVVVSGLVGFRSLPRGNACPNCAQETLALVSLPVRAARMLHGNFSLQRRWCPTCEWDGFARMRSESAPNATPVTVRHTQQLRTLELGGRAWRVMLESWREQEHFYGRLLFVGPSGKRVYDADGAFDGSTHDEVIGQALALSDGLLAYRLRDVISH